MSFGEEIWYLFAGMHWLVAVLLLVGVVLCIIEIIQPGFGVCGILGGLSLLAGIVLRVVWHGEGDPVIQFFFLFGLVVIFLLVSAAVIIRSMKKGVLARTPLVEHALAVPEGHTESTKDYSYLVGKRGVTVTDLHPVGLIEVDGETIDALCDSFLQKGARVEVIEVEGIKVIVKEIIS